ncbi:MAG: hypothetical protein DI537_40735 [Stutzerimonas stutzeri]|nr:MAG: hypothetical protein DI537_40735 [Stutzerimonas stutzeri]
MASDPSLAPLYPNRRASRPCRCAGAACGPAIARRLAWSRHWSLSSRSSAERRRSPSNSAVSLARATSAASGVASWLAGESRRDASGKTRASSAGSMMKAPAALREADMRPPLMLRRIVDLLTRVASDASVMVIMGRRDSSGDESMMRQPR